MQIVSVNTSSEHRMSWRTWQEPKTSMPSDQACVVISMGEYDPSEVLLQVFAVFSRRAQLVVRCSRLERALLQQRSQVFFGDLPCAIKVTGRAPVWGKGPRTRPLYCISGTPVDFCGSSSVSSHQG